MSLAIHKSQRLGNSFLNLQNVFHMQNDMLGFVKEVARTPGTTIKTRIGFETVYLLKDPKDLRTCLIQKNKSFSKSTPGFDGLRAYLGQGLLSSNSDSWALHRRLAQPSFQANRINGYFPTFRKQARQKVARLKDANTVDLNQFMASLTLSILGDTILNFDLDGEAAPVAEAIGCIFATTAKRIYNPFRPPLALPLKSNCPMRKAKQTLREVILRLIDRERSSQQKKLSLTRDLMDYRDERDQGLRFQEIFDEIITMIQAGHETSSNALIWTMIHLHENREIYEVVRKEVRALPESYSTEEVDRLPYLEATILESLRLDPPAWAFDRRATTDVDLSSAVIRKNNLVLIAPIVTHRDPEFWTSPEKFDISHFYGKKINENPAYLPFGLGPRFCIGQNFAMLELKTVLAEILRSCDFKVNDSSAVQREGSITLRPKGPVIASFDNVCLQ